MILDSTVYLGPARVLAAAPRPGYVRIAPPDGEPLWARLALAVPYSPAVGDEILAIRSQGGDAYAIGLLSGTGTTTLRVPGDLHIEAPAGEIRIGAAGKVRIDSADALELAAPQTSVRAARLNLLATNLVQRVTNAFTWASGLVQTKSDRQRCVTENGWLVRAGRAHIKTKDNVHIDGKTVHLG
jgi:hypothetical protein